MNHEPVDLTREAEKLEDFFSPRVVGRVNDHYVKVAKTRGDFVAHTHEHEDELFLLLQGKLVIELEDGESVTLRPGQMYIVPRGVRHAPRAEEECWLALIEPVSTTHTGDVITELTKSIEEQTRGWDDEKRRRG